MSINDYSLPNRSNAKNINLSLKRDKTSFHMSTAAYSTAQTIQRDNPHSKDTDLRQYMPAPINNQNACPINSFPNNSSSLSFASKIQNTQIFKCLEKLVKQEQGIGVNSKNMGKSGTHTYLSGLDRPKINSKNKMDSQYSPRYSMTQQQSFLPKVVEDTFKKYQQASPINYHFGYLQRTGYLYFSIQKTLVLVNHLSLTNQSQTMQPIVQQVSDHVVQIKQIVVSDLTVQDIECHPFGQKNVVLMMWQPWKVCFYSFWPTQLVKLENLNIKIHVSCEIARMFEYCGSGNIYYLSQNAQLGRITLFNKQLTVKNILNWNWNKKFNIRQYFFKFKHNTSRKYQKIPNLSIFSKIRQNLRGLDYYFRTKKNKPVSIVCDRQKMLLYTLVQTSLKTQNNLNRAYNQSNRQIRIYNIDWLSQNYTTFGRVQQKLYSYPPTLLLSIDQQKLYNQVGSHLFSSLSLSKFQIASLYIPKSRPAAVYQSKPSDIVILLSIGSRLYFHLKNYNLVLNEIVNLPNLEELTHPNADWQLTSNNTITQKQPNSFKLIRYAYNSFDDTLAILGLNKRNLIGLLFTTCQYLSTTSQNSNKQEVKLVFDQPIDDQFNNDSIFVNSSDYLVCITPQLQANMYKNKVCQLSLKKDNLISQQQQQKRERPQKIKKTQFGNPKNGKFKTPQSNQVLHYPQRTLFLNFKKNLLHGVAKLRPVDILLNTLQDYINQYASTTGASRDNATTEILLNEYQIGNIFKQIQRNLSTTLNCGKLLIQQIIALLIQIYCDVDGVYFCKEYSVNVHINKKQLRHPPEHYRQRQSQLGGKILQETISSFERKKQRNSYHFKDRTQRSKIHSRVGFTKVRYSDLLSQQKYLSSTSPFKIKSQNSTIRVIQKLVVYTIKTNNQRIREFYKQKFTQNQWLDSSVEGPSPKEPIKKIQLGILTYLSRLMSPLWFIQVKLIQNSIFIYLIEISKKIFELILKAASQSVQMFYQQKVQNSYLNSITQLISTFIQYNSMLQVIQVQPNVTYGVGFAIDKQALQETIFMSLQRLKNTQSVSSTVNRWRKLFPNYFSLSLFKAIKLQAQINQIASTKQRKQIVIKNSKFMPSYLLYSYYKDGTLNRKQINKLIQTTQSQKQPNNIKNVSHLVMTDSMDPQKKVQYALNQVQKSDHNLQEKQFLVNYALQNVNFIRGLQQRVLHKKKQELNTISRIIKIQQLISNQLKRILNQNPNFFVNQNTMKLLNFYLLNPSQLRKLLKQLKSPVIQLICYCTFPDIIQDVNKIFKEMKFDQKDRLISSVAFREKLAYIFQNFSKNCLDKIPINSLVSAMDEVAINEFKSQNQSMVLSEKKEQRLKQFLWVPLFLSQWGWNQSKILDHYIEQAKKSYSYIPINMQKLFMYYWSCGYALVKWRYKQGRRIFQISNQAILRLNANLNNNDEVKILIDFIRQNLVY